MYRLLRTSALLAMARRYRQKLFGLVIAIVVAVVTSWLYGDIATFLNAQYPQFLLAALVIKTLIVYGVLVYVFWSVRPGAWDPGPQLDSPAAVPPGRDAAVESGPLDELLDKPKLSTRRDSLLHSAADRNGRAPPTKKN